MRRERRERRERPGRLQTLGASDAGGIVTGTVR